MIELIDVTKVYDNGTRALSDVSLKLRQGEFAFIVGSSGSGKSTLLKLILKEEEPSSGKVVINDVDITNNLVKKNVPYLRREIGMVFQDFRLFENKTVFENVAFAMKVVDQPNKKIRRMVPLALTLVGLEHKAKSYPRQLSGGEKQRVAIARAIINKPSILICDEPTGNLDPETSWEIMGILEDINKKGTTVLMVTHDHSIVKRMKKRVLMIERGKIVQDIEKGGSIEDDR